MRIIGIDPGIAIVGYGILDFNKGKFSVIGMGSVETRSGIDTDERIETVYDDITEIIKTYSPDVMAIEELFFNTNQKTAIAVAEARGVVLLAARKNNVEIFEYTPLQVKQSVVGYGRAEKKQVMEMVRIMLGIGKIKLDDTADALALAICHANTEGSKISGYFNQKKKKLL